MMLWTLSNQGVLYGIFDSGDLAKAAAETITAGLKDASSPAWEQKARAWVWGYSYWHENYTQPDRSYWIVEQWELNKPRNYLSP